MVIITYLLGNVLDIIEYIILMGMGGGSQVLILYIKIAFSNFFQRSCKFFFFFLAAYQFRKNSGYHR